jgi:hypothetical protein
LNQDEFIKTTQINKENKAMSNSIKQRYLESLDSVRYVSSEDIVRSKKHAEIEIMLSLLFGECVVIPEPYSFDSLGFLKIAGEILPVNKRQYVISKSPVLKPFKLAIRRDIPGHSSYREMIGTLLKRDDFSLSAWSEIDNNKGKREQLAEYVTNGKYREAKQCVDNQEDEQKIETLNLLDDYFSDEKILCPVKSSEKRLNSYVNWIAEIDCDYIDKIDTDSEIKECLENLVTETKKIQKEAEGTDKRSIYKRITECKVENGDLDPNIARGILGFVDSCYNNIVAESVQATSRVITTKNHANNPYIQAVEEVTLQTISNLNKTIQSWDKLALWINPDNNSLDMFPEPSKLWNNVWDIVLDDDWIQSVEKLHKALIVNSDNAGDLAEEALTQHIDFLAKALSSEISLKLDKGIITFVIRKIGIPSSLLIYALLDPSFSLGIPLGIANVLNTIADIILSKTDKGKEWYISGALGKSVELRSEE